MKKKIINYDSKHDIFYLAVKKGYEERHQEVAPEVFVELDKKGALIGIEILHASKNIGKFFGGRLSHSLPRL